MTRGFLGWMRDLMDQSPMRDLSARLDPSSLLIGAQSVWHKLQDEVQRSVQDRRMPNWADLAQSVADQIRRSPLPLPQGVVNATGWVLHPRLVGPALSDEAVRIAAQASEGYVHLRAGAPSAHPLSEQVDEVQATVEAALRELTGAAGAVIFSSAAAALAGVLQGLSAGRETVVPKMETWPVAGRGGLSLEACAAHCGTRLREVGVVQGFQRSDLEAALGPDVGLILRRRSAEFRIVGESWEVPAAELGAVALAKQTPLVVELGGACLADPQTLGLPPEVGVKHALSQGADLVVFRTDGLVGGPPLAAVVGRRELLDRIRGASTTRLSPPGLSESLALWVTLEMYRDSALAYQRIPVLRLLSTSADNLRSRCERLVPQLAAAPGVKRVEAYAARGGLSPRGLPGEELATWRIDVEFASPGGAEGADGGAAQAVAGERYLGGPPGVLALSRNGGVAFDLRSVDAGQDPKLVQCLAAAEVKSS